jgi:hypothetical protein
MTSTGEAVDWLDDVVPAGTTEDDSWLEIDEIAAPKAALPYDPLRFSCMRGSGRVWACDGRYVAYRPFNHALDKQANPAFQERIEKFTRAGHFKHLGTFDEVMVFELLPESPWYAHTSEQYTAGRDLWADIRHAAKLACNRDWRDYADLLEAMAVGMRGGIDPGFAKKKWEDAVQQIAINIQQRGGPTHAECIMGVRNVRAARGHKVPSKIVTESNLFLPEGAQYGSTR